MGESALVGAVFAGVSVWVFYLFFQAFRRRMDTAPGSRFQFWLVIYVGVLGAMIVTIVLGLCFVEHMRPIVSEDGPVEWATCCTALAAAGVFAVVFWRRRGMGLGTFSLALGLLCFLIAGEEIAWGQRVLGIQSPEFFAEKNIQNEITIHNLQIGEMKVHGWAQVLIPAIAVFAFILGQIAFPERMRRLTGVRLTLPAAGVAILFSIYFFVASFPFPGEDVDTNVPLSEAFQVFFQRHSSPLSELSELLFVGLLLLLSVSLLTPQRQLAAAARRADTS
jgi:hypothetical protein